MPRALRLESENASYHVINRGNYRCPVFASAGAKRAFLRCFDETCLKTGWRVHAWAVMSNHFHLAVTTPRANLAAGMHRLQCTFAARFNRFRSERGHVFQGRFKSIAVENGDTLGSVCHYIHLNPVRARLCATEGLVSYPWTSLWWIHHPKQRPDWFDPMPALQHAGGLLIRPPAAGSTPSISGWLAEDEPAQNNALTICHADGRSVRRISRANSSRKPRPTGGRQAIDDRHAQGVRSSLARGAFSSCFAISDALPRNFRRPASRSRWKVALAAALKMRTTVTNQWLSENLHLGNRHEIGPQGNRLAPRPQRADAQTPLIPTPHNPTP